MSKQYHPKQINLEVSLIDISLLQELTDMYFTGVLNGSVLLTISAHGTSLMFDNAEDLTLIELDPSILKDYSSKIKTMVSRLSRSVNPWTDNITASPAHQFGDIATHQTLTNWTNNTSH